ncbi:CaiB/BaiF CoA-transferase family protein [uncultured Oscillibacter sp.]|uniref:CaiB/BaiF CoA transferase family protein n=1 Tax=uncultured Oscillibacter sp. TaxID=876091 RepID=UPI002805AD1A|nr:CaiB/BaiF CoA-transferase family protein [uncultured Oscillibacter sp.]
MNLLEGMLVLDFSQYLAAPSAALRLADFGARVIKVERPDGGDNSRRLTLRNLVSDGDAVNFQAINRNKASFTADLKNPEDLAMVKKLVAQADVMIENFRPGVMKKIGLDYETVCALNPRVVYGTVTGYGSKGPWVKKPGQDLLIQSLSGLAWLGGNADMPPTPFGLSVVDSITGVHLVQGILSCLLRREKTGAGGHVEVSLLESTIDLQFEMFSTYLNNGHRLPQRCAYNNAHAYLGAPYGIYPTSDGFIAISIGPLEQLADLLELDQLKQYADLTSCMRHRDEIKEILCAKLQTDTSAHWLQRLRAGRYWCSEVYNWKELMDSDGFQSLGMILDIRRDGQDAPLWTTRCPLRIDGERQTKSAPAPRLGQDREEIIRAYKLRNEEGHTR